MINVMTTPRTVDLELTSRCNLRCRYCYYMNNEGVTYEDLPTDRWLAFFEEMGRAKVMSVCLAGGEPLIRQDFFELIDGIVRNRMRFELLTNGILLTKETAQQLKATNRCNSIQVSLDGSTPEIHERLRGRGSFAPALQAIRILQSEGLPATVRVTVHAFNVEDLPAIAHLLLEEIGLPSFSTNAISSLGTQAKYGDDLFMTPAARLRAMQVLAELDQLYPGRIEADAGPLAEWKMFHEMERIRASGGVIPGRGKLVGCGCIFKRISVRADGAYVPCVMMPQIVMGYIGIDPLEKIWRDAAALNNLRDRVHIPLTSFARCRDCEYNALCTGNCAGTALSATGDPNQPSMEGCLKLFQEALAAEGLSLW